MDKVEEIVNRVISEFENKPIATTIKGLFILWVLKEVMKWWKK